MTTITYGDHVVDFSKLPEASVAAILRRGLTHYLGNEQASKLASWVKGQDGEVSEDAKAARKAELVSSALSALQAGTIGQSVRMPKVDPVEAEMDKIAKGEIKSTLAAAKMGFKGKGEDRKVTFADGSAFTLDELVERRLANPEHSARIRREAEKAIKARARQAEKAASAGPVGLDAIG